MSTKSCVSDWLQVAYETAVEFLTWFVSFIKLLQISCFILAIQIRSKDSSCSCCYKNFDWVLTAQHNKFNKLLKCMQKPTILWIKLIASSHNNHSSVPKEVIIDSRFYSIALLFLSRGGSDQSVSSIRFRLSKGCREYSSFTYPTLFSPQSSFATSDKPYA